MTNNPGRCPNCGSHDYSPDPGIGGAGRNVCNTCKRAAPVVAFHPVEPDKSLYQQIPEIPPEGYRTDRATGGFRPAKDHELFPGERSALKTSTKPAPIRQYKDD